MRIVYLNTDPSRKAQSSTVASAFELLRDAFASDERLSCLDPLELVSSSSDGSDLESVEIAVVDSHFEQWDCMPRLRLVCVAWAGVDKLLNNLLFPRNVPCIRLVDASLGSRMAQTALYHVISRNRTFDEYSKLQRQKKWMRTPNSDGNLPKPTSQFRVVVAGMGVLGSGIARVLVQNGFTNVLGWGTSARTVMVPVLSEDGLSTSSHQVPVVAGINALKDIVRKADVVIDILPATNSTHNLFNFDIFSQMAEKDATFINLGRGATVVEHDLLHALDDPSIGLSHAILDVFQVEPLPLASPLWDHPSVVVTPHMAALTDYADAAPVIANSIKMFFAGHTDIPGLVDFSRGF